MKKTKSILAFSAVILAIFLLCSCGSGYKAAADEAEFYYDAPKAEDWGYNADFDAKAPSEKPSDDTASTEIPKNSDLSSRKFIKTVNMSAQTKTYDEFISSLKAMITANGGYIESSKLYDDGYKYAQRSANFVVRIPADRLDAFVDGVNGKATVTNYSEALDDVTLEYVDLDSRIGSLRTERDKLNELLLSAENLDQVILLQDKIEYLTYQIESFESKIRTLSELISYSTVNIGIIEVEREEIVEKQGTWEEIGNNLSENFADVGEGFRRFFIGFVSDIPYILVTLLVLAIILAVLIVVIKIIKKKHKKQ